MTLQEQLDNCIKNHWPEGDPAFLKDEDKFFHLEDPNQDHEYIDLYFVVESSGNDYCDRFHRARTKKMVPVIAARAAAWFRMRAEKMPQKINVPIPGPGGCENNDWNPDYMRMAQASDAWQALFERAIQEVGK